MAYAAKVYENTRGYLGCSAEAHYAVEANGANFIEVVLEETNASTALKLPADILLAQRLSRLSCADRIASKNLFGLTPIYRIDTGTDFDDQNQNIASILFSAWLTV